MGAGTSTGGMPQQSQPFGGAGGAPTSSGSQMGAGMGGAPSNPYSNPYSQQRLSNPYSQQQTAGTSDTPYAQQLAAGTSDTPYATMYPSFGEDRRGVSVFEAAPSNPYSNPYSQQPQSNPYQSSYGNPYAQQPQYMNPSYAPQQQQYQPQFAQFQEMFSRFFGPQQGQRAQSSQPYNPPPTNILLAPPWMGASAQGQQAQSSQPLAPTNTQQSQPSPTAPAGLGALAQGPGFSIDYNSPAQTSPLAPQVSPLAPDQGRDKRRGKMSRGPGSASGAAAAPTASPMTVTPEDRSKLQGSFTSFQDTTSPTYGNEGYQNLLIEQYRAGQLDPDSGTYKTMQAAGFNSGGLASLRRG